jgi:hypothetical protein
MNDHIVTSDQIPDNPLEMPPPYWRSGSAIYHVINALTELPDFLSDLSYVHKRTKKRLNKYYERHPNKSGDEELEEFVKICSDLWRLEEEVKDKAELAVFMSAIEVEDLINRFCVFNLHKDISESIESLSPAQKLLIASAAVGKENVKGTIVYEGVKKLSSWRNAFAHGHCVDRPTKSLRHNHLIAPSQYPGVPDTLAKMQELVNCFIRAEEYLRSISVNPYTAGKSVEIEEIGELLQEISAYRFIVAANSNDIYDIECDER